MEVLWHFEKRVNPETITIDDSEKNQGVLSLILSIGFSHQIVLLSMKSLLKSVILFHQPLKEHVMQCCLKSRRTISQLYFIRIFLIYFSLILSVSFSLSLSLSLTLCLFFTHSLFQLSASFFFVFYRFSFCLFLSFSLSIISINLSLWLSISFPLTLSSNSLLLFTLFSIFYHISIFLTLSFSLSFSRSVARSFNNSVESTSYLTMRSRRCHLSYHAVPPVSLCVVLHFMFHSLSSA